MSDSGSVGNCMLSFEITSFRKRFLIHPIIVSPCKIYPGNVRITSNLDSDDKKGYVPTDKEISIDKK